jgi:cation diffusion facilitator family transporter
MGDNDMDDNDMGANDMGANDMGANEWEKPAWECSAMAHDELRHSHGDPGHQGRRAWVRVVRRHRHDPAEQLDPALEGSRDGIRALKVSLLVLAITAAAQAVVVAVSGSIALLGDTLHNFADALTAVPLWIAFAFSRRAPNRRYTYGYGRAEDIAGVVIVATIAASAVFAAFTAVERLVHPEPVYNLVWVAAAAVLGFAGNELAAHYRIRTGRRIGSAALVADGLHARTDGITSLAVLVGAGGVALGFRAADPLTGLLITVAILLVLKDAGRSIYYRLMDAVSPTAVARARDVVQDVPGVQGLDDLRLRWIGHQLHAEVEVTVGAELSLEAAHAVAHDAHHRLLHAVPRLATVIVHASPASRAGSDPHASLAHHLVDPRPHEHEHEDK